MTWPVLICGEDLSSIQSLQALVESEGFSVDASMHPSQVVGPCLRGRYKLAIVALGEEDESSEDERLELIRLIHEINPRLPVVVVSGPESLQIEREIRSLGIFYLLTTPLSRRELRDVLRCALGRRER
ncbi:MAG TPA: hypothetical protein VLU25_08135 [Acidobacteriota bacterium]|nr:hypothetical protein [Acidobacteriota bacterium]